MLESKIQSKILEYLRKNNHYAIKVQSASKAGVPDIMACIHGRFVGIEVKNEKGVATLLQLLNIDAINNSEGNAIIARSVDDVEALVKSIGSNK